jgi:hypothetical protein
MRIAAMKKTIKTFVESRIKYLSNQTTKVPTKDPTTNAITNSLPFSISLQMNV